MPRTAQTIAQDYPRIQDENSPYHGCLDDSALAPHKRKITASEMERLIISAIANANAKSSREILSISVGASEAELEQIYTHEGKELFDYFRKYCGDPASTAYQVNGQHYRDVGREQFRNRTLQKERMNSRRRYQYLATGCAQESKRFRSVSDIGAAEGDFNAVIEFQEKARKALSLYVSMKNRSNTMGGQDWPKAILALENLAKNDRNKTGPYCCVFGMAMDRGVRYIKREQKTKKAHSVNTEVWLSDFFWPFFANASYEEIMTAVLDVLIKSRSSNNLLGQMDIPAKLLDSFGEQCRQAGLIDDEGHFSDPHRLVRFFCQ
jgi:hypothetical protein